MAGSSLASAAVQVLLDQVSLDQVSLFMALGGAWQDTPAVAPTSQDAVTK